MVSEMQGLFRGELMSRAWERGCARICQGRVPWAQQKHCLDYKGSFPWCLEGWDFPRNRAKHQKQI